MILRFVVCLVMAFLLAPLVVIVLFSFHASPSLTFPWAGFSLRWYSELLSNAALFSAVMTSLTIAGLTAATVFVLGTLAALAYLRMGPVSRNVLEALTIAPIALPGLFIGVSLLTLFALFNMQLSLITIVIGHVVISFPIMMVAVKARMGLFDSSLEEASRDLGASQIQTFLWVTLPLILPTIVSSAVLAFAVSFDEFVVTSFTAGTETTVPMLIWSMMRRTVTPSINVISTLAIGFSVAMLLASVVINHTRRNANLDARNED